MNDLEVMMGIIVLSIAYAGIAVWVYHCGRHDGVMSVYFEMALGGSPVVKVRRGGKK